jgi:hypothetical protein
MHPILQQSVQQKNQVPAQQQTHAQINTSQPIASLHPIQQPAQQAPNLLQPQNQTNFNSSPVSGRPPIAPTAKPTDKVVTECIDSTDLNKPGMPYDDDILRLLIKTPDFSTDESIELLFHLVNDDPVAVAHEMVSALNLPKQGVLEISERISGTARNARMKQDQYKRRGLIQQQQQQQQQQQGIAHHPVSVQNVQMLLPSNAAIPVAIPLGNPNQIYPINAAEQQNYESLHTDTIANTTLQEQYHISSSSQTITNVASNVQQQHEEVIPQQNIILEAVVENPVKIPISNLKESVDVDIDDDSTSNLSEIKKLKLDYESKVTRANKAYQTRMENLRRSKEENEAQHRKTLEKHEKERLAFDKRAKQAEKDQQERVQKLAQEFKKQKANALQSKQLTEKDSMVVDP